MRTSGSGHSELWMTAIPISIILVFLVFVSGGPAGFLRSVEKQLRSTVEWTIRLAR